MRRASMLFQKSGILRYLSRSWALPGYVPDGREACRGHQPLSIRRARVIMNDDLIIWLTSQLHP
jgi:hypothetical protein